jgi:hypothetical protein
MTLASGIQIRKLVTPPLPNKFEILSGPFRANPFCFAEDSGDCYSKFDRKKVLFG